MREALHEEVGAYPIYEARRPEYATTDTVPFRVADQPLGLSAEQYDSLQRLCRELGGFVAAADELYRTDEEAAGLLNRGKPEVFLRERASEYLFFRPDLLITDDGYAVCEIETSPFGLGLAVAVNNAYRNQGHETIVNGELAEHLAARLPESGVVVYSEKTRAYRGQLGYLSDRVLSADGRDWTLEDAENTIAGYDENSDPRNIYRAFYLREYDTDPAVHEVIDRGESSVSAWTPSLTPHLEEKAIMAFLWDRRWENYFRAELGHASYDYLQTVIPPAWIVGEESHFLPGLPGGAQDLEGLAQLPRSKRMLVLKSSGYDDHGSWAEGVHFLHQKSRYDAARLLASAAMSKNGLQIVQEFRPGKKLPVTVTEDGVTRTSEVRIRLTPYIDPDSGKIIAAKATGRSGTDFIHASSDSVNCAVGVR